MSIRIESTEPLYHTGVEAPEEFAIPRFGIASSRARQSETARCIRMIDRMMLTSRGASMMQVVSSVEVCTSFLAPSGNVQKQFQPSELFF